MAGLTMLTALELFTNPGDLEFVIRQDSDSGKFAFGIYRGEGHQGKPLITSRPFAATQEEAIRQVEEILVVAHEAVTKEFQNKKSIPSQYLNSDGREVDQSKVLSRELITRILDELREHREASTCKMVKNRS